MSLLYSIVSVNINEIIRIRTLVHLWIRKRNFHQKRAGLAGWYCRAGCGRSSHFGDEISLSNPAPCFIYPSCLSAFHAMAVIPSLRLTSWPTTNNSRGETRCAGCSSPQVGDNPRFSYPDETYFCVLVCQKSYDTYLCNFLSLPTKLIGGKYSKILLATYKRSNYFFYSALNILIAAS